MPITGQEVVARNIIKYMNGLVQHTNLVMRNVEAMLDEEVTKNISLSDHTLADLAKLGHPYSLRSGQALHDHNYQIHTQSGALLNAKSSGTVDADITGGELRATAFVKLDADAAPHAVFVIFGTSKMIPRPALDASRDNVAPDVLEYIKTNLKNTKVTLE